MRHLLLNVPRPEETAIDSGIEMAFRESLFRAGSLLLEINLLAKEIARVSQSWAEIADNLPTPLLRAAADRAMKEGRLIARVVLALDPEEIEEVKDAVPATSGDVKTAIGEWLDGEAKRRKDATPPRGTVINDPRTLVERKGWKKLVPDKLVPMPDRCVGTLKWFDHDKGYGVIEASTGVHIAVHANDVKLSIREGKSVSFRPEPQDGVHATEVSELVDAPEAENSDQ